MTQSTIDIADPSAVSIGLTRGETSQDLGPPRDHPDRVDLRVERADGRVRLSVDVTVGDHGTGHLDLELDPDEARALAGLLEEAA